MVVINVSTGDVFDTEETEETKEIESPKMDAHTKLHLAIYDFESRYNIYPNRIIVGWVLASELNRQFHYNNPPFRRLREFIMERKDGMVGEFKGIPVEINYNSPELLEVGYMVKWID